MIRHGSAGSNPVACLKRPRAVAACDPEAINSSQRMHCSYSCSKHSLPYFYGSAARCFQNPGVTAQAKLFVFLFAPLEGITMADKAHGFGGEAQGGGPPPAKRQAGPAAAAWEEAVEAVRASPERRRKAPAVAALMPAAAP